MADCRSQNTLRDGECTGRGGCQVAHFDIPWYRSRPEGAKQISVAQRPGKMDAQSKRFRALKGRNNGGTTGTWRSYDNVGLPSASIGLTGIVSPLQGEGRLADAFVPGRCPGLICGCPFGANERNRAASTVPRWVGVAAVLVLLVAGTCLRATAGEADATKAAGQPFSPEATDFFESRVRPILVDQCIKCHGPKKQSSSLRLDSREAVIKGGDSGPSLVPAKPDESLIVQAVAHTHEELKMPPSGKLPEASVAIIRQWVALGAPWSAARGKGGVLASAAGHDPSATHWAFQPLRSPALPAVKDRNWGQTPVDAFVLARLEAAGMTPSARADKRTLIRRATIDLWGIPPTADEIDAFERDQCAGRIRPSCRSPAGLASLWRTVGPALAGCGPLCRHQGLRLYAGPSLSLCLHLPRLCHQGVQRRPAVRPVRRAATGRRSARREARPRAARGDGILDGRPAFSARSKRDHRRPHRRGLSRLAGADGHVRPLPRPQVRPDP